LASSVGLHAVLAVALHGVGRENARRREAKETATKWRIVEMTTIDRPREPLPSSPTPQTRESRPADRPAPRASRDRSSERSTHTEGPPRKSPAGDEGSPFIPGARADGEPAREPKQIDLSLHPTLRAETSPRGTVPAPGSSLEQRGLLESPRLKPSGDGTYAHNGGSFKADIARDGSVTFSERNGKPKPGVTMQDGSPALGGSFDVNDAIMAMAGDNTAAYDELKFLEATRPMRQQMADEACKEQLAESVLRMRPQLEAIWNDGRLSLAKRHRLIFQLWDQCAEDGTPDVRRTSEQIRAVIVDFINKRMPQSSVYAYSPADLDELNRSRRSQAIFAPYARD
jgi:hypothetical protein